jgi:hypothetical protein
MTTPLICFSAISNYISYIDANIVAIMIPYAIALLRPLRTYLISSESWLAPNYRQISQISIKYTANVLPPCLSYIILLRASPWELDLSLIRNLLIIDLFNWL